jgi:protein-S-isoprenylcysteine O-methyltransferase Ste14
MISEPESPPPDHAGVWFPPPLLYVAFFIVGYFLQKALPLPLIPQMLAVIAGPALVALGVGLALWSAGLFRRRRTSLLPIMPARALVLEGPYRMTRNPMYLGLLLAYLGMAILDQRLWPVFLSPLLVATVNLLVIRKEERYLERKFGDEFVRYMERVGRWW